MKMKDKIKSVIFICTANSGRSPMAEYYFKDLCKKNNLNIRVDSAGTDFYNVGIASSTLQLLKNDGIDASEHQSRVIDQDLLLSFDLILVMDQTHIDKIVKQFPDFRSKTYLLSEYTTNEKKDVVDPVYMDMNGYIKIYNDVKIYLHKLFEMIIGGEE